MRKQRLQKGQGQAEYALLLVLIGIFLMILVAVFGRAPRQMLSDVYCMLRYKSSATHAVDNPQPVGSALDISLGSHTPTQGITWAVFKTTYTWQSPDKFVCVDGQVAGSGDLSSYTVYAGN